MAGIFESLLGLGSALGGYGNQQEDDYNDNPIANILGIGDINKDIRSLALGPGISAIGNPMSGMGMLSSLFGGGGQQQPQNAPPGTITETGAMGGGGGMPTPSLPNQGEDITVTGDGWKPRQPTILGAIADAYLMSQGMKPAFAINRDARNVNEAMGDYVNDPRSALKRLSLIRGHEDDVAKLFNQERDNDRADMATSSLAESRQAKYMTRIGGLLNAIRNSKDPVASYRASLPILRKLQERAGDTDGLGDEYDANAVNNYIGMNVDPDDQIKMTALNDYRNRSLDLREKAINNTDAYRQERLEDFDNQEDGRNARKAGQSLKQRYGGRAYRDENGSLVEFNPDGTGMKVTSKDGKSIHMFKVGTNGKPVLVNSMSKQQYDQLLAEARKK